MSQTHAMPRQFRPNAAMIALADACYLAIANESHVRGIVEGYRAKVLRERDYYVDPAKQNPEAAAQGQREVITDVAYDWLMSDADYAVYTQRCQEERARSGLTTVKEGNCPLSEAAYITHIAKTALFDSMSFITGVTAEKCISVSYQVYQQLMELILNLFSNHVSDTSEILSRAMFAAGTVAAKAFTPTN